MTTRVVDDTVAKGQPEEAADTLFDLKTRQGEIGQAAVELFYRQGFHATGMREIGRHLGWTVANLYNFFPSKEKLLYFLLESVMKLLISEAQRQIDFSADAVSQLKAAIRCHVLFHSKYQKEALISDSELRGLREEGRRRITEYRDQYEAIFRGILAKGVEQGCFKPMNIKLRAMAIILMCTGVEFWYRPEGEFSLQQISDDYSAFVLEGIQSGVPGDHYEG